MKSTSNIIRGLLGLFIGWIVLAVSSQALAQGTWETKAPMLTAHSGPVTGVIAGKLHVVGGAPAGKKHEVYDPTTNSWSASADALISRAAHAGGVINGKLYVVGGCISFDCRVGVTDRLERFDPGTGTWTTLAPMPTPRGFVAAAVVNGKLHVVGGNVACGACIPLTRHEVYDPAANTWTTKASMLVAVNNPAAVAVDGLLYVVGGQSSTFASVDTLQVYDPGSNIWLSSEGGHVDSMPTARPIFRRSVSGKSR